MTFSRVPKGVSTLSMPMEPVTKRGIALGLACDLRTRELTHFYTRRGHGVQAAGRQTLVALEEAGDGVVLLDVAAFELKVDDAAVELWRRVVAVEKGRRERGIGCDDFGLIFVGGFEHVVRGRFWSNADVGELSHRVAAGAHRFGNGGREIAVKKQSHEGRRASYHTSARFRTAGDSYKMRGRPGPFAWQ